MNLLSQTILLAPSLEEGGAAHAPVVSPDTGAGGVFDLLRDLVAQGLTVLMVEQNVNSALKISDDAVALASGVCVLRKPAAELLLDPHIERLFLGGSAAPAAV